MSNYPYVPYGTTVHGEDEINAVVNVLKTSTQMGKNVRELEEKVAGLYNKKYGIGVNSGSSALYLAADLLNYDEGTEIITLPLHFQPQ
jgi:CDP-6-deoxy-D-xylo-4-hexulose-3-dehydrase